MSPTDSQAIASHQKGVYGEHWSRFQNALYLVRYPEASAWRLLRRSLVMHGVQRRGTQRVFDFGFGHGKSLLWFSPPTQIHGVELSPSAMQQARLRAAKRGFDCSGLLPGAETGEVRTPFADDSFDVVICSHTIEHVPSDEELLAELRRVLKPGGKAFLLVPLDLPESANCVADSPARRNPDYPAKSFHVWLYNLQTFEYLVRQAGLAILSAERVDAVLGARAAWPRPIQVLSSILFSVAPYSLWGFVDRKLRRRGVEGRQAVLVATK